jgi:lipoyl(octanoyl) transferase
MEWLGRVAYADALDLQLARVEARRRGESGDVLLLLEHPPVVTLGRSARLENLLVPASELAARGIELHEVARGGDVTYHGPGQLVGYLVVDLAARGEPDVIRFVRRMEGALIDALASLGLAGRVREGYTGVFVDAESSAPARKIASIGVGLRGWVTYHGFALNLTLDLEAFGLIVPCGLRDVVMTSVARELGTPSGSDLDARGRRAVAAAFARAFGAAP